jgi:hypothetical protein
MSKGDDEMEISGQDILDAIEESDLPEDLKVELRSALPKLLHNVGEVAKTVYDPNSIWLEAIQYADYVEQYMEHIKSCDGDDCTTNAIAMTKAFKQMAEHAMRVLDQLKVKSELIDWETVKITFGKENDAQQ